MPESVVTLYLESWQKRMLKDFCSKARQKVNSMIIKPGKIECLASYKIPPDGIHKDDWVIYLTDAQIVQLKDALNLRTAVTNLNVTPAGIKSGAIAFR